MSDGDVILGQVHATWLCGKCDGSGNCTVPGCAQAWTIGAGSPIKAAPPTSESEMAMAAPSMPSALDVSGEWVCDTGTAYDLVPKDKADTYTDFQAPAKAINFQTANGTHRAETTLSMVTPGLGELGSDAYIMENTPPALAVGRRVMNHGYSSIWIKGKRPCWILPEEGVAVLSVKRTCPYYDQDTEVYPYDDERLPELCGIRIRMGEERAMACPVICLELPAAPAVGDQTELAMPLQEGGAPSSAGCGAPYPVDGVTPMPETIGETKCDTKREEQTAECQDDEEGEGPDAPGEGKTSPDHLLTHKPADPDHCETCMRAKSRNVKKFAGAMKRDPVAFGDLITLDHMGMKDAWKEPGVGGMVASLDVLDHATRYKAALPVASYEADEVAMKLREFCGNQKIKAAYLDNHPSLVRACKELRIVPDFSQPGMPQTNGLIESTNGDILSGTRAQLVEAGLPGCFWPWAAQCYCHHENTKLDAAGSSPWYRRHGAHWSARLYPFGCGVYFKPSPTKYKLSKSDSTMQYGIFLGYRFASGDHWKGEYLVADLSDFANQPLHASTSGKDFSWLSPHVTKRVRFGKEGVVFPLKKRYDESNNTLEGIERSMQESDPFRSPERDTTEGPTFGASDDWLKPFDPSAESDAVEEVTPVDSAGSGADVGELHKGEEAPVPPAAYVDKLGRVYPVDRYGNILRKTCRPFGVSTQQWKSASKKQKKEIVEAFEGVPPTLDLVDKWATMTREERVEARKKAVALVPPPEEPQAAPPPAVPADVSATPSLAVPSIEMIEVHIDEIQQRIDALAMAATTPATDRLRRPALPRDFPQRAMAAQRRKRWRAAAEEMDAAFACDAPAMCTIAEEPKHRHKDEPPLFPACVARPVSKTELFAEPGAVKALKTEWGRLWEKKVWDHDGVREWANVAREAASQGKEIHMGRLFGLCVEKGSELPKGDKRRKYKYRVVFGGNNILDQTWEQATFQSLGSSPASMSAGKFLDYYSCVNGNSGEQADAEQAYIQAELKGPETWVYIPPEGRPEGWDDGGFRTPVVRLRKAIYGHPNSGSYWEEHCNKFLLEAGFKPIEAWPSCFWHEKLKLMLSVYVDDFKLSGPKESLKKGWDLIRKNIQMEDPTPLQLYLGCIHRKFEGKLEKDGPVVNGVEYDMESFLASCVQRYLQLCADDSARPGAGPSKSATKRAVKAKKKASETSACEIDPSRFLTVVTTPFLNDSDQKESPQGAPCDDPNHPDAVTCPWCRHRFVRGKPDPVGPDKKNTKPADSTRPGADTVAATSKDAGGVPGESTLNHEAASVLMKILYAARMARFDLLKATNALACKLTKWDKKCDLQLRRLVAYIWSSLGKRLVGYVSKDDKQSGLHLYTDADLGGCPDTQRSTTGVFLCIRGDHTMFPLVAISKRQSCASVSTPEAELVAGSHGLVRELIPALDMCDKMLPAGYDAIFHEDNQAMIRVIETGRNPTMRYLHRTHRISIATLHEIITGQVADTKINCEYTTSTEMAADIFTKGFTDKTKWDHAMRSIGIIDLADVPHSKTN